jgi:hypothetical protein
LREDRKGEKEKRGRGEEGKRGKGENGWIIPNSEFRIPNLNWTGRHTAVIPNS